MKNVIFIITIIIAVILLCSNPTADSINIVGSTSVQPICEELVEEYKKIHPDDDINIQGGGSSLAIKCTKNNISDIGMVSCDVNHTKTYELGRESIIIIVNPDNPVSDLTTAQLKDIFSGKICDWSQITSKHGKINVIIREKGSGTLTSFEKLIMNNTDFKKDAIIQNSAGAVKQSVMQDKNAIGFVSLTHLDENIKDIKINGISASQNTIQDGSYTLQRPFTLICDKTPDNQTLKFLKWTQTKEAEEILNNQMIY